MMIDLDRFEGTPYRGRSNSWGHRNCDGRRMLLSKAIQQSSSGFSSLDPINYAKLYQR